MSTTISAILTRYLTTIGPDDNLHKAAQMMRDWNVDALPVCDSRKLIRAIAAEPALGRRPVSIMPPAVARTQRPETVPN